MAPIYLPTKELIALKKEDLWFFYDESDRIDYLIHTYGRTTRLTFQQEEIRRFIAMAHRDLDQLEWEYQKEQRQAEEKKRQEVEAAKRQQAKSKELQKATHEIVSICSSIKDDLIDLLAHIRAEREQGKDEEATQEQENEDVRHSGFVNNCDVSLEILEATKVEPTIVSEPLEAIDSCDESREIIEIAQVKSEIVCEQQTERNSEVVVELFITKENQVCEVNPVQADHVEFIIPDNLLQRSLKAKAILLSAIFPKNFESYRMKRLSTVLQSVSMKRSIWFILSFYKTRGRVFSNKGRNDGDHICNYLFIDLMFLFVYGIDVMLGVT